MIVPPLDTDVRQRLRVRFGPDVETWFDALPETLTTLSRSWGFELGAQFRRGSGSVVYRCALDDGSPAVVKVSPDLPRIEREALALRMWSASHAPEVLADDAELGAILMELIEPGTALVEEESVPEADALSELLSSLHLTPPADAPFPALEVRVDDLFRSSTALYDRDPGLTAVISHAVYERGHELASELADDGPPRVLHGDLTPSNVLVGPRRSLVAVDPAVCVGDPAFDAVDLLVWRAFDRRTLEDRVERLAVATGLQPDRLLAWCAAFAGMIVLEQASVAGSDRGGIEMLRTLATEA